MQLNFVFESMCVNHAKVLKNFFGHGPKNSVAIVGSDEAQPGAEPSDQEDHNELDTARFSRSVGEPVIF